MPTEYGANQYVNELYNIRATVDNIEIPHITALTFKHKVNSSRVATITVESRQGLEMMRIGGILKVNFGLSDAYANKLISVEEGTLQGLTGSSIPNDFYGRIKVIKPGLMKSTITAMDLVSDLATSKIENIQWKDYGSQSMYMVARDICDYKGIEIEDLKETMRYSDASDQGKLTSKLNIYGYQTRKSFLDKLFELMAFNPNDTTIYKSSSSASTTYMTEVNPFVEFYYAIRQGKKMEFFAPNKYDQRQTPVLKIGPNEANVVGEGLVGQIDSSSIINSITISSTNDASKVVTMEDGASIEKYGVFAKNFSYEGLDTTAMNETAFTILHKYKEPTNTYKIELVGAEWVQLGDLVEVSSPLLSKTELLPVVEKTVSVTDRVVTNLTVGSRSLDAKRLLQLVQR